MKRRHRYRFLLLDTSIDGTGTASLFHAIDNSSNAMNAIQDAFVFQFERDIVKRPDLPLQPDGSVHEDDVREAILAHCRTVGIAEYPIAILTIPLHGGTWANIENDSTVISLHAHGERSNRRPSDILKYLSALAVLEQLVETPSHDGVRGCVNDFCDPATDPRYLDAGMTTGEICGECLSGIHRGVSVGQVGATSIAAVQRIFDAVAGRRVCFLISPMNDEAQPVLGAIRSVAENNRVLAQGAGDEMRAGLVMHRVVGMLARATSCIADLSGLRPNVLYELGWADALMQPVLLVCRHNQALPFDLGHKEVCFYDPARLTETLSPRLEAFFRS